MFTRTSLIVLATVGLIGLGADAALAGSTVVSGSFENTYSKRDMSPVIDEAGPVLMLTEGNGTNTDTSGSGWLNGFSENVKEIADLTRGTGPHDGYASYSNGQDGAIAKFEGQITTTMNDDGTPNTTFKGKWHYVKGTGKYDGLKGEGTYAGYFLSQDTYHVDWKGYMTLPSESVSER